MSFGKALQTLLQQENKLTTFTTWFTRLPIEYQYRLQCLPFVKKWLPYSLHELLIDSDYRTRTHSLNPNNCYEDEPQSNNQIVGYVATVSSSMPWSSGLIQFTKENATIPLPNSEVANNNKDKQFERLLIPKLSSSLKNNIKKYSTCISDEKEKILQTILLESKNNCFDTVLLPSLVQEDIINELKYKCGTRLSDQYCSISLQSVINLLLHAGKPTIFANTIYASNYNSNSNNDNSSNSTANNNIHFSDISMYQNTNADRNMLTFINNAIVDVKVNNDNYKLMTTIAIEQQFQQFKSRRKVPLFIINMLNNYFTNKYNNNSDLKTKQHYIQINNNEDNNIIADWCLVNDINHNANVNNYLKSNKYIDDIEYDTNLLSITSLSWKIRQHSYPLTSFLLGILNESFFNAGLYNVQYISPTLQSITNGDNNNTNNNINIDGTNNYSVDTITNNAFEISYRSKVEALLIGVAQNNQVSPITLNFDFINAMNNQFVDDAVASQQHLATETIESSISQCNEKVSDILAELHNEDKNCTNDNDLLYTKLFSICNFVHILQQRR